jgi:quinol monooxygenase YgiN
MTNQVQYTTEFIIIDGKIEDFKKIVHSIIESVKEQEQDMSAYQVYLNAEENKAFIVEWFKNSEAILIHLANVGPLFPGLLAIAPAVRLEVFGNLTAAAEEALKSTMKDLFVEIFNCNFR